MKVRGYICVEDAEENLHDDVSAPEEKCPAKHTTLERTCG